MGEVEYNLKSVPFHATEAEWLSIDYIPRQGELIIYDADETYNYIRFKTGNGLSQANKLPFSLANLSEVQAYVNNQIGSAGHLKRVILAAGDELPSIADADTDTIYMKLAYSGALVPDIYEEYMVINGAWEIIGNTKVDLTSYATIEFVENQDKLLADVVGSLSNLETIDKTSVINAINEINVNSKDFIFEISHIVEADAENETITASTTYEELLEAYNNGRTIRCLVGESIFSLLGKISEDELEYFAFIQMQGTDAVGFAFYSDNTLKYIRDQISDKAGTAVNVVAAHNESAEAHPDIYEAIGKVLPTVTTENDGEFLRVSNGVWISSVVQSAEEVIF